MKQRKRVLLKSNCRTANCDLGITYHLTTLFEDVHRHKGVHFMRYFITAEAVLLTTTVLFSMQLPEKISKRTSEL